MTDSATYIRWARPGDVSDILRLIKGLAAYENEPETSVKTTEADLLRDGFGDTRRFECLIAELDGAVVGFALFFANYSTWEGRAGIYLEDLYVDTAARGHGLGQALMTALAAVAKERDCDRIDLAVLDWNPTRDFYHAIDCQHMDEWLPYRLSGDAIRTLAAQAQPIAPA